MARRKRGANEYDPRPLQALLRESLARTGESARGASLAAGLADNAISKYLRGRVQPSRDACIALAAHFGLDPNEVLRAAGYAPVPFYSTDLSPEVRELATLLEQVEDADDRSRIIEVTKTLIDAYRVVRNPKVFARKRDGI